MKESKRQHVQCWLQAVGAWSTHVAVFLKRQTLGKAADYMLGKLCHVLPAETFNTKYKWQHTDQA